MQRRHISQPPAAFLGLFQGFTAVFLLRHRYEFYSTLHNLQIDIIWEHFGVGQIPAIRGCQPPIVAARGKLPDLVLLG